MRRFIIFLVRRHLGLKKFQWFRFVNQKSNDDVYYFTSTKILKIEKDSNGLVRIRDSSVSLNWLLDDECEIEIIESLEVSDEQ